MGAEEYTDEWHVEDAVVSGARSRGGALGSSVPTPTAGAVLRSVAAALGASAAVQAGADSGVSGLYLLEGMRPDGVLTSIEESAESDAAARESFRVSRAGSRVRSINGAPLDVLSRLTDHAYDLVVVGAGLGASAPYLDQARRLLRTGGAAIFLQVLGDNDVVADLSQRDDATMAARHFVGELAEDPSVISTLLPVGNGTLIIQTTEE